MKKALSLLLCACLLLTVLTLFACGQMARDPSEQSSSNPASPPELSLLSAGDKSELEARKKEVLKSIDRDMKELKQINKALGLSESDGMGRQLQTASALSNGNLWLILLVMESAVFAVILLVVLKKKKDTRPRPGKGE